MQGLAPKRRRGLGERGLEEALVAHGSITSVLRDLVSV